METPKSTDTKKKFSKKIVRFVIISNCIFALLVLAISVIGNEVPDALIISWFAFTGTELLALAGIKITDTQYGAEESDSDEKPEDDASNKNLIGRQQNDDG